MLLLVCSLGFITLNSRFNKVGISGVIPPIIEGDWIIDEDVVLNRSVVKVTGSVLILKFGSLTMINSTLYVGYPPDAQIPEAPFYPKNLTVKLGGILKVLSNSTITSTSPGRYYVFAEKGSTVEIKGSRICNAGFKTGIDRPSVLYIGPAYVNDLSKIGHGLEFETPVRLEGNVFLNVCSIRFYADNNVVQNNTCINVRHAAFEFMSNSTGNIIRHNTIINASAEPPGSVFNFDRETYGIRFYPPSESDTFNEVSHNFISNVTFGIFICHVPLANGSWTARRNMTVHDNHIKNTAGCFVGTIEYSHVYREKYENYIFWGLAVSGKSNKIENSVIENATLHIPYLTSNAYYNKIWEFIRRFKVEWNFKVCKNALGYPFQRHLFQHGIIFYKPIIHIFYSNGSHMLYINTRDSTPKVINTPVAVTSGEQFSIWFKEPYVYCAIATGRFNEPLWYGIAKFDYLQNFNFSIAVNADINLAYANPFIAVDERNKPWISYMTVSTLSPVDTLGVLNITRSDNSSKWQTSNGFPYQLSSELGFWGAEILPIDNDNVYVIFGRDLAPLMGRLWNYTSNSWHPQENISASNIQSGIYHSALSYQNRIHVVFLTDGEHNIVYCNKSLTGTWGPERIVQPKTTPTSAPILGLDSYRWELYCLWVGSPEKNILYYKKLRGGVWDEIPLKKIEEESSFAGNDCIATSISGEIPICYVYSMQGSYRMGCLYSSKSQAGAWWDYFRQSRFGIFLDGNSYNITINGNTINNIPSAAIIMDGLNFTKVNITNNNFSQIAHPSLTYPFQHFKLGAIFLEGGNKFLIENNTIQFAKQGITTEGFSDGLGYNGSITIRNNLMINISEYSINLGPGWDSHDDPHEGPQEGIITNNLVLNSSKGISLNKCRNLIVMNNSALKGISASYCKNLTIEGNVIELGMDMYEKGFDLNNCENLTILNNLIESLGNYSYGIYLGNSNNTRLEGNVFEKCGLFIDNSFNNTVIHNLVNGKSLVYMENLIGPIHNTEEMREAGQVILVKCKNIHIEGLKIIMPSTVGVQLVQTEHVTIKNSNLANNLYGAYITGNNASIQNNNFTNNYYGVHLTGYYNEICKNNFMNNSEGVYGIDVNNNGICGNNFINNDFGLELESINSRIFQNNFINNIIGLLMIESGNVIYHNNFINNYLAACGNTNYWNLSYPYGGNYWSNYSGVDEKWGPFQNITGSDGIGDTPYVINSWNIDYYPLMYPWPSIDIAILNITFSPPNPISGDIIYIHVNVTNMGKLIATFNVSVEYTLLHIDPLIGTQEVTLLPGESTILNFTWTPTIPGLYEIKAYTTTIIGDINPQNNVFTTCIIVRPISTPGVWWRTKLPALSI
jgi:hypothetical protein